MVFLSLKTRWRRTTPQNQFRRGGSGGVGGGGEG